MTQAPRTPTAQVARQHLQTLPDDLVQALRAHFRDEFAAEQRERRSKAIRNGIRASRSLSGRGSAWGAAPYGYAHAGGHLVPVPEEQEVIHRIVEMQARGLGIDTIASTLTAEQIPPRRGRCWNWKTVHAVLERERARRGQP